MQKRLCLVYSSDKQKIFIMILLGSMVLSASSIMASYKRSVKKNCVQKETSISKHKTYMHAFGYFVGDIVVDILAINRHLFSVDTAKILTGFAPVYLVSRRLDESIQSRFYEPSCHANINQFHPACHDAAQIGICIPMVGLSSLAFWGWTEDLRTTGRIFALGLPFVHWTKDLIKNLEAKICLRPWHQKFSCVERSSGGFPSGHMANITYATSLFAMRFGPKWGVPLGLFATFLFADFLNHNRHYLSQLCAGAAFGLIYAFAANKVIENKLNGRLVFSSYTDRQGSPGIKMQYVF
jgi:hypothetical protein